MHDQFSTRFSVLTFHLVGTIGANLNKKKIIPISEMKITPLITVLLP